MDGGATSAGTDGGASQGMNDGKDAAGDDARDAEAGPVGDGGSDAGPTGPTFPKACDEIYDPSSLPSFELTFEPGVWEGMLSNCDEDYHPAQFHYGKETIAVMVRNKGNWSFSCDKPQLVIAFNETNKDGRWHGLRKLMLDAPWYDHTLLHERLAFFMLGRQGVPASCVNNARLSINGAYFGLYANVERLDREYLERNFKEEDGNLWKGFKELETNKSTATYERVNAFWEATDLATLEGLVDLEQAVEVWAGEAMLPDRDSYWAGVQTNFFLYDHPTRGFLFLPYDSDLAFASPAETGEIIDNDKASFDPLLYTNSDWGREEAMRIVLSDPYYCGRFVEALTRAHAAYDVQVLQQTLMTWSAQIAAALADDKERSFTDEQNAAALDYTHTLIAERSAFIGEWLKTEHCPAVFPPPPPPPAQ